MSNTLFSFAGKIAAVQGLLAATLAFGTMSVASAQTVTVPPTPTTITVPVGNTAFLVGHATGSQGYTCLPAADGTPSWTVNPPRPEATLFTDVFGQPVQIITHFLSINEGPLPGVTVSQSGNATWQSSFDTSRVWAKATGSVTAGTDLESCPNNGAIPCLRLEAIGQEKGPTGGRLLAKTTFVQRLNTNGGAAPAGACSVGQTILEPYTADYYFYKKSE
jgi:hypothetical protein